MRQMWMQGQEMYRCIGFAVRKLYDSVLRLSPNGLNIFGTSNYMNPNLLVNEAIEWQGASKGGCLQRMGGDVRIFNSRKVFRM